MIIIRITDSKLEKAFSQLRFGSRLWGEATARKYIERVNALQTVNDISEFAYTLSQYRDHPLKGEKNHRRAFTLHDRLRVEYEPDEDGKGLTIKEVSSHYGD